MKKTISLKWRTLKYLVSFVSLILIFLFVFQTLLLRPFYKEIKTNDIISVAGDISNNISNENIEKYIQSKTQEKEMCILVVNEKEGFSTSNDYACPLMRMTTLEFIEYTKKAIDNGGTYLLESSFKSFDINNKPQNNYESLTYIKVDRHGGNNYVIMVNTNISPLNATIKTITTQLIFVSIVVLLATLILTLLLTSRVIKPLEDMNKSAKLLPKGKYKMVNDGRLKELSELNETLNKASDEILKADNTKRELISNVSHDLRTPLTLISSYGEMMLDMPNERNEENIQLIINESKRMNALVNDLLDLSKIQENKMSLNKLEFNLTELLKEVVNSYVKYLDNKIHFDFVDEVIVNGDKDRISQVVNNFINNSINYSFGDIIVKQQVSNNVVVVEVIDEGEGINEEDLPLIWDRYFKVDKSHERASKGSGIGLAIAKEILELHNFDYVVKSTIGKGSIFYFSIPVIKIIEK